jgi:hypothetical protein
MHTSASTHRHHVWVAIYLPLSVRALSVGPKGSTGGVCSPLMDRLTWPAAPLLGIQAYAMLCAVHPSLRPSSLRPSLGLRDTEGHGLCLLPLQH